MKFTLVAGLKAGGYSQRRALAIAVVSRSAYHYRHKPRPPVAGPVPHKERAYPSRVSAEDQAAVIDRIHAAWEGGDSVLNAFATAWDEGVFLASQRQWYRIANRIPGQGSRPSTGTRAPRPARKPPVVVATGPGQAWTWDITDLNGTYVGQRFKAYSIQDLYSRKVVGHIVAAREDDQVAVEMFSYAFGIEGIPDMLHSDNGSAMTSNALGKLCADLKVTMSFSRPQVSNDNPFKESEFRTLKYRPSYPGTFDTLQQAQAWVDSYIDWFNTRHHHSGLALHTPQAVHDGSWKLAHTQRTKSLAEYYQAHPGRFRRAPRVKAPAREVGINLHHRGIPTTTTK